jgi:transcriptional regulator with XRE-family HTH domain
MPMKFGRVIRGIRIKRKLTIHEIAKCMDVSSEYVSSIEIGRVPITEKIFSDYFVTLKPTEEETKLMIEAMM